jgi:8-oxo-dGTP diphosphatase
VKPPILQVAAKAVIVDGAGRLLLVRESRQASNAKSGLYGIVGGRLEPGESFFDALHREVKEETGLSVTPIKPIFLGEWRPTVLGDTYHIVATFFWCHTDSTEVTLSPEHDHFIWINPADYPDYPVMQPDDRAIHQLIKELRQS